MSTLYDVPAPAKLNLFLHVVGRRSDGYHLLQTVFRFIDLNDYLDFDLRHDGIIDCASPVPGLAPQDDLVVRAAQALQRATGTHLGVRIQYRKHIPSGGGLGGGSSDAASTLIALNRLWNTGLSRAELMRLALPLGADVPVFIYGQPAFAEGIGELLSPAPVLPRTYVVVQPAQSVPTAGIFSDPNLTRDTKCTTIAVFADWQKLSAVNKAGSVEFFGQNNLQPVVFARYPVVAKAHALMQAEGAYARMTGSGSCLFAEFVTAAQAAAYQQKIVVKIAGYQYDNAPVVNQAWVCQGLVNHPLRSWLSN